MSGRWSDAIRALRERTSSTAADLDVALVIDVVQMQQREDARVRAAAFQVRVDVDALEERAEGVGGEAAHPLVEVAENHLRALDAPVVDERRQPRRLVPPLEHRRAEMDVVDVQRVSASHVQIRALARAGLAGAPRQIVLAVMHDRENG